MKRTKEELERLKQKRAATAAMTKCDCGNVARLGQSKCGRCLDEAAWVGRRTTEDENFLQGL